MVDIFILPALPLHPLAARLLPLSICSTQQRTVNQTFLHLGRNYITSATVEQEKLPSNFTPLPTPRNFESALSFLINQTSLPSYWDHHQPQPPQQHGGNPRATRETTGGHQVEVSPSAGDSVLKKKILNRLPAMQRLSARCGMRHNRRELVVRIRHRCLLTCSG